MGSQNPPSLPIIDFSKLGLKPGSLQWDLVKAQVRLALEEYGCFQASFKKVPLELRKAILSSIQEIYDLPLQTKLKCSSERPFRGYVGQHPMIPLFESMVIDEATNPEKIESFANILWPEGNPELCKTIQSFTEQLSELDQIIRRMVIESLGVENYLDEHMDSTSYLLRVMKYKGPQTTETKLGLSPHKDTNILSILYQNQVDGLEVQARDGEWISVNQSPDSFMVIVGESLHAWSNGRLYAPHHRVMMRGNEARYTLGMFTIPKAGYIVKAPEELVDEEHPLLFKPFDYDEYLGFFYSPAGRKAQCPFTTYCGA